MPGKARELLKAEDAVDGGVDEEVPELLVGHSVHEDDLKASDCLTDFGCHVGG